MNNFEIETDFENNSESKKELAKTFKECVLTDIQNVFFNINEFTQQHLINGKEIPVLVDDDKMNELIEGKFTPLDRVYEKMILFYVQKELLGFTPKVNSNLFFDNEMYQVADVSDDGFGVLAVTIGKNTGV